MRAATTKSVRTMGLWSAWLATVFGLAYVVGQLAEWFGWLGSRGGPESASTLVGLVVLLTPSLFLGPSFLVLVASIHRWAPGHRKVWSQVALAFATIYCTLITITYYVQLTLVAPRIAAGRVAGIEPFLFVPFDSFLYAADILGYTFMSAATLFAAGAFERRGRERWVRGFLIANGALIPFVALQMYWHDLIWFAAAWAVTFPASTVGLALHFRDLPVLPERAEAA